jgi:hypothetical protein
MITEPIGRLTEAYLSRGDASRTRRGIAASHFWQCTMLNPEVSVASQTQDQAHRVGDPLNRHSPVTAMVPALETHSATTAASLARPMIVFVSEVGQIEGVGDELFAIAKFLRVGGVVVLEDLLEQLICLCAYSAHALYYTAYRMQRFRATLELAPALAVLRAPARTLHFDPLRRAT